MKKFKRGREGGGREIREDSKRKAEREGEEYVPQSKGIGVREGVEKEFEMEGE